MLKDIAGSGNLQLDTTLSIAGKAADAKAVGDAISKLSGGKVAQPDWNQNDPTAPDYMKNRPFYKTDSTETIVLENEEFVFDGAMSGLIVR